MECVDSEESKIKSQQGDMFTVLPGFSTHEARVRRGFQSGYRRTIGGAESGRKGFCIVDMSGEAKPSEQSNDDRNTSKRKDIPLAVAVANHCGMLGTAEAHGSPDAANDARNACKKALPSVSLASFQR
jgi:hypothetical protein